MREHEAQIGMSRVGKPSGIADCGRFMRAFKVEDVLIREYADLADARRSIARCLDLSYNLRRLHSALGFDRRQNSNRFLSLSSPQSRLNCASRTRRITRPPTDDRPKWHTRAKSVWPEPGGLRATEV